MNKFFETLGSQLAEHWFKTLFTPALVFWTACALLWSWQPETTSILVLAKSFLQRPETEQLALLVILILAISASAHIVQFLESHVTKALEGYWFLIFKPLKSLLIKRQQYIKSRLENQLQLLVHKGIDKLNYYEREQFTKIDASLMQFPAKPNDIMPTRFGNLLRSMERRPLEKYGLDAVICWSRLWYVLPDQAREDLVNARSSINQCVRLWVWCCLFLFMGYYSLIAFAVALGGMLFAYRRLLSISNVYTSLVESAFDVYRKNLYKSMRWPLPKNPAEELALGTQLTNYLWRGSAQTQPAFTNDTENKK